MSGNNGNGAHRITEQRCRKCGRMLFRSVMGGDTRIDIRCPKCGLMNVYKTKEVEQIDPGEYSVHNFRKMIIKLKDLTAGEIADMITLERNGQNRSSIINKLERLQS